MYSSCDIKGSVNGKNIIEIEDQGSISNLIIDIPSKGIWCKGSCTLTNIFFKRTCYHAVDFGNSQDGAKQIYQVNGGAVINAVDKVFTQAGAGTTIIQNFCAQNFSKVYRSCGELCSQHPRNVSMTDCRFKGPGLALISLNYNYKDTMYINNVKIDPNPPTISFGCQQYKGTDGSATMTPEGQCLPQDECNLSSCEYKKGSIIVE
uniref:Probable pectate lyase F n=1 Tax=Meloidogyne hapla TaxID=6305 RepID=A0A1I8C2B5_MELHA